MPNRLSPLLAAAALLAATACASPGGEPSADSGAGPPEAGGSGADGGGKDGGDAAGGGPLDGATVVIDPGHNGGNADAAGEISALVPSGPGGEEKACDTVGAETADGDPEHAFTWSLATLLQERLEDSGAEVVLTREDDEGVGPCVDERAAIGNEAGADAAISLHADGGPESGRGFHVIAPGPVEGNGDVVGPSADLAELVRDSYAESAGIPVADYLAEDGLDERTDLGGLNMSTVPKVFLEAGNMRNPEDAALLEDPQWRERAANSIARALAVYLLRE